MSRSCSRTRALWEIFWLLPVFFLSECFISSFHRMKPMKRSRSPENKTYLFAHCSGREPLCKFRVFVMTLQAKPTEISSAFKASWEKASTSQDDSLKHLWTSVWCLPRELKCRISRTIICYGRLFKSVHALTETKLSEDHCTNPQMFEYFRQAEGFVCVKGQGGAA